MSDIVYRGYLISLSELKNPHTVHHYRGSVYKVSNNYRTVFEAYSKFGLSYGRNTASALKGAQELIDRALDKA